MKLRLDNVFYDHADWGGLQGISTTLQSGSFTCLLGANGSGKTTFLRLLTSQLFPHKGVISFVSSSGDTISSDEHFQHFAFLPQDIHDPPYVTVRELVALGRFKPGTGLGLRLGRSDHQMIDDCLEQCRITEYAGKPFAELSGGEKQRAWLAFCIAQDKPFLVLDEPLHGTDFFVRRRLFQLLADVVAQGRGVLLTTHDLELANRFADHVLVLHDGTIHYDGPPREDWNDYLLDPYQEL